MKQSTLIYTVIAILIVGGIFFLFNSKLNSTSETNQPSTKSDIQISGTETILMKPDSFEPSKITIKKNTKVTFKNEDSVDRWPASNIHPTHGIYPEFDPRQPIPPGSEWSFVFDRVGTWKMHDHLIPSLTGEITVTE